MLSRLENLIHELPTYQRQMAKPIRSYKTLSFTAISSLCSCVHVPISLLVLYNNLTPATQYLKSVCCSSQVFRRPGWFFWSLLYSQISLLLWVWWGSNIHPWCDLAWLLQGWVHTLDFSTWPADRFLSGRVEESRTSGGLVQICLSTAHTTTYRKWQREPRPQGWRKQTSCHDWRSRKSTLHMVSHRRKIGYHFWNLP